MSYYPPEDFPEEEEEGEGEDEEVEDGEVEGEEAEDEEVEEEEVEEEGEEEVEEEEEEEDVEEEDVEEEDVEEEVVEGEGDGEEEDGGEEVEGEEYEKEVEVEEYEQEEVYEEECGGEEVEVEEYEQVEVFEEEYGGEEVEGEEYEEEDQRHHQQGYQISSAPFRPRIGSVPLAPTGYYVYSHPNPNGPPPPPKQAQQFGHGAPTYYTFQYSTCTGRRKALMIGINYFGQEGELHGCINDVKNMSNYLHDYFNYKWEDITFLTDEKGQGRMKLPTRENILREMQLLVEDAQPNDSLFFHYSGHGGQTKDFDGDEVDEDDETICPVDGDTAGDITDDEMHEILVQPLQPGVRLTAIFDSCHSGSALDLPYIYSTQGILKEPDLAKEAGKGLLKIALSGHKDYKSMTTSLMKLAGKAISKRASYKENFHTKTSPADVIMFSGCKDTQFSRDAVIAGEHTGAMSWAFVTTLTKNPQQSYVQLLNSIRDALASKKYDQKPQLSCSHPLVKVTKRHRHKSPFRDVEQQL